MGVLRELNDFYQDAINRGERHLKDNWGAVETTVTGYSPSMVRCAKHLSIHVNVCSAPVEIMIGLPYNFPDVFPVVGVGKESFHSIYPIPHLDLDNGLCVFDSETSLPNPHDPEGIITVVVNRSIEILTAGISGANTDEYLDEFDAYWNQNVTDRALSLVTPTDEPKEILYFTYERPSGHVDNMFVDAKIDGMRWAVNLGGVVKNDWKTALYLPLESLGNPPYPRTNRELLQRLYNTKQISGANALLKYLNKNSRPSMVLFSIAHDGGNVLGAWQHKPLRKPLRGHRVGTRNAKVELLAHNGSLTLNTLRVIRVDQKRLFMRGGNGLNNSVHDRSVAVIGCGSVGGFLAQGLVERGLSKLLLVDPDVLTYENIARHVCGASDVGHGKVNAVRNRLIRDYPYIDCGGYAQEITEVLCADPGALAEYDLTVVAIGRFTIECRLNQLLTQGSLRGPVVYVWVEPYLAAGHAVWVDGRRTGCFECLFNTNFEFVNSVLEDPGQYVTREAGCQSSYVPYGITDVRRFIIEVMEFIQDGIDGRLSSNTLLTWVGDLTTQRAQSRRTMGKWAGAKNYTTRRKPILDIGACRKCRT